MSERPENYEHVLSEAKYRKRFSVVRWECMLPKIEAVLNGEKVNGDFEGWTSDHAKKLRKDLAEK